MKVRELIEKLSTMPQDMPVLRWDEYRPVEIEEVKQENVGAEYDWVGLEGNAVVIE